MKNQSRTIKTNPELYRVVMDSSGGHRRLPGESDHFSLQTNTASLYIYQQDSNHHQHQDKHHQEIKEHAKRAKLLKPLLFFLRKF